MRFLTAKSICRLMVAFTLLSIAAVPFAQKGNAQVAQSPAGPAGQRQLGTGALPPRPFTRINNRVQTRLRNRIDRLYDHTADAASPFDVANDQVKVRRR